MANSDEEKKYLTIKEVAERLGYSPTYVQTIWPQWAKFEVKAYRMGRKILFKTEDIDRMVEMHAVN